MGFCIDMNVFVASFRSGFHCWSRVPVNFKHTIIQIYDPVFTHSCTGIKPRLDLSIRQQGGIGNFDNERSCSWVFHFIITGISEDYRNIRFWFAILCYCQRQLSAYIVSLDKDTIE